MTQNRSHIQTMENRVCPPSPLKSQEPQNSGFHTWCFSGREEVGAPRPSAAGKNPRYYRRLARKFRDQ